MLKLQYKLYRLLSLCLLGVSTSAYALTGSDEGTAAYVDSIYGWGPWELGLEPAAGEPSPSPSRVFTARDANIKFRPNDNSAFSPESKRVAVTNPQPTPIPVVPVPVAPVPVAPVPIPVAETAGTEPLPAGGPGDRFR